MNSPFIMSLWAAGNFKHISKAKLEQQKSRRRRVRTRENRKRRDGKLRNGKMVKTSGRSSSENVCSEIYAREKIVEVFIAVENIIFFLDSRCDSHSRLCTTSKVKRSTDTHKRDADAQRIHMRLSL